MISLLSMVVNTVAGLFIHILKAVFSMLSWFVRAFIRFLKLFFCLFPVTAVVFALLFCANIFLLLSNGSELSSLGAKDALPSFKMPDVSEIHAPSLDIPAENFINDADEALANSNYAIVSLFDDLKSWWLESVYSYKGSIAYIFLLILTVVMFVPVITVLLSISVFVSFRDFLFISIIIDVILYLLRAVFGKNFVEQLMDRYYRLFPAAGKKHYEKDYERWLRKHHREFTEYDDEDEEAFYEKGFYEEDNSHDYDFYEDEDDIDDEEYEDYYEEDEYADDEYFEDDESDKEYDERRSRRNDSASASRTAGTFDFFAGCNSRESVDRKYKSLVKLYHPDNMDGNTAALQEINIQYEQAKKRFK